jgi:maleate isomerase
MSEWSGRVGALVPSNNAVFERDAALALPPGVSLHTARMTNTEDTEEQLGALRDRAAAAASDVADADVGAIAFACTTGSLLGGVGYDQRICELITDTTGVPATTTSTAVVEALRAAGAERLVLVSPYEPWLNARVVQFLEGSGFSVADLHTFALADGLELTVSPEDIADAVRSLDSEDVDAAFISCTNFRGMEASQLLEHDFGKPVVSSNGATLSQLLNLASLAA